MKNWKKPLIGLAAVLMLTVGLFRMSSGQTAAPPPTRLAVLDIVKVFDSLNEKVQTDQEMTNKGKEVTEQKRKYDEALTKLAAQLKDFKPESQEFKDVSDELLKKGMEARSYAEYSQQRQLLDRRTKTAQIYKRINDAVAAYSQANGIALVLVTDEPNVGGARSEEELLSRITVRKIVYAHPSLDISQAIIDKMNSEYKLGGSK